ncbi:U3 small nucleolar RNA-associated protein 13 [Schistosoma japonicum]|nr:U3 small nucleolar RNA-associated protein 13 [Schistosoma japonicum]
MATKLKFKLADKFQPCFSSQYPIFHTVSGKIYCGRDTDDSLCINVLDGESFALINRIQDDDFITSFVVDEVESRIFIATKNLLLKRFDNESPRPTKVWMSCHQRIVQQMAIGKSSTRLATGSGDTVVRLWHIGPKEGFSTSCRLHQGMITLLKFHPTLPYLFSSSIGDHFVAVWDIESGKHFSSLEGHQSIVTCLGFNVENNEVVTCGRDKVIIVWSSADFTKKKSLEACAFLPVGALTNHLGLKFAGSNISLLLTGGQWGCLRCWDLDAGRCVLEIRGPLDRTPQSDSDGFTTMDRHSIDYGLHSISYLNICNIRVSDHCVSDECTSSSPRLLLVRQSNHVEFYDPLVGKLTAEFLGDIGQVDQLCIAGKKHNFLILADASPHLKIFLNPYGLSSKSSADQDVSDKRNGSWKCHLIPGGHTDVIMDLSVSTCGQWIASGSKDQSICLWHLVEPEENSKALSQSSKMIPVKVDLITQIQKAHAAHISSVCFDKLTAHLISSSEDGILKVWNVQCTNLDKPDTILSELSTVHGAHGGVINSIDVSVDSRLIATASRDKTVKIWEFEKQNLNCQGVLQGHRRGVWSVCFSKYEKIVLTASGDGDVRIWNLKDFSCIRTLEGHDQPVYKAVFISHDKQPPKKNQESIENPDKPSEETSSLVYEAHDGRIWSLAVCPDESGFFTGGEDETLCYFEDITEMLLKESSQQQEEYIQTQQELDNLVHKQMYADAVHLAVKLDQPKRTLDILQELLTQDLVKEDFEDNHQNMKYPTQAANLLSILDGFVNKCHSEGAEDSLSLCQRLLSYAINWNTRTRTSMISQFVLNWILTRWTPEELLEWPNFTRHYERICRLEEQLAILNYIAELTDEHLVPVDSFVNTRASIGVPMELDNDENDASVSVIQEMDTSLPQTR